MGCDHKFIDSNHCVKCGWVPPGRAELIQITTGFDKMSEPESVLTTEQKAAVYDEVLAQTWLSRGEGRVRNLEQLVRDAAELFEKSKATRIEDQKQIRIWLDRPEVKAARRKT